MKFFEVFEAFLKLQKLFCDLFVCFAAVARVVKVYFVVNVGGDATRVDEFRNLFLCQFSKIQYME